MIDCYICKKPVEEGTKFFPFCSSECKEVWKLEHPVPNGVAKRKYKSIEACQRRIAEMRQEKNLAGRMFWATGWPRTTNLLFTGEMLHQLSYSSN